MELRKATAADAVAIADVHIASWRNVYKGVLKDETLEGLDAEVLTKEWVDGIERPESPDIRIWVLSDNGSIVGYSRTGPNRDSDIGDASVAEVYGFYTHPNAWGSGAGSLMMDGVLNDFRERGFQSSTLWVVDENPRARRFYEKKGWRHEPGPVNTCFGAPEVRYRIDL